MVRFCGIEYPDEMSLGDFVEEIERSQQFEEYSQGFKFNYIISLTAQEIIDTCDN